jgi:hypothetical protein
VFVPPHGGKAFGYPATILADICDAIDQKLFAQSPKGPLNKKPSQSQRDKGQGNCRPENGGGHVLEIDGDRYDGPGAVL